jgi:post-segregation antitoxin (ccd killing protein)
MYLELTKLNCKQRIVIDVDVHQALKEYSHDTGISMSVLATNAIHEYLKKDNYDIGYMNPSSQG